MASVAVFAALQAKDWSKKSEKKLMQRSVWGQLTGRVNTTGPLNNEVMKIPNSVVAERSKEFESGVYSVTVPWKGKISTMGRGGRDHDGLGGDPRRGLLPDVVARGLHVRERGRVVAEGGLFGGAGVAEVGDRRGVRGRPVRPVIGFSFSPPAIDSGLVSSVIRWT
jgi:hypothetical protein